MNYRYTGIIPHDMSGSMNDFSVPMPEHSVNRGFDLDLDALRASLHKGGTDMSAVLTFLREDVTVLPKETTLLIFTDGDISDDVSQD